VRKLRQELRQNSQKEVGERESGERTEEDDEREAEGGERKNPKREETILLRPNTAPAQSPEHRAYTYYREALEELAKQARRTVIEDEKGALPGCAERAAIEATRFLFDETMTFERVIPETISREELERFFKPAPQEIMSPTEHDLEHLEERYPGTISSILKSAKERAEQQSREQKHPQHHST
jgi:hypothetical protein